MRLSGRRKLENRQTALGARADNVAVGHEMQVGIERPLPTRLFATRDETLADEVEGWALGDDGTAEIGVRPLASLSARREEGRVVPRTRKPVDDVDHVQGPDVLLGLELLDFHADGAV
jgi:hypothetical protein